MLIQIICFGFLAILLGLAGFHQFDRKERAERAELAEQERIRRETYCVHCAHGLTLEKNSGSQVRIVRVECDLKPECPGFERRTQAGQAVKLKWREP